MLLNTYFAGGVVLALATSISAHTMTFCNEVDSNHPKDRVCPSEYTLNPGPNCTTVPLIFNTVPIGKNEPTQFNTSCAIIPDYSAKGDINSCGGINLDDSAQTNGKQWNPHDVACIFYEDQACSSDNHVGPLDGALFMLLAKGVPKTTIFRSYRCWSNFFRGSSGLQPEYAYPGPSD